MKISEIEDKIACNELSAAQVFTQMKQHLLAALRGKQYERTFKEIEKPAGGDD